jgi:hypothetical protein
MGTTTSDASPETEPRGSEPDAGQSTNPRRVNDSSGICALPGGKPSRQPFPRPWIPLPRDSSLIARLWTAGLTRARSMTGRRRDVLPIKRYDVAPGGADSDRSHPGDDRSEPAPEALAPRRRSVRIRPRVWGRIGTDGVGETENLAWEKERGRRRFRAGGVGGWEGMRRGAWVRGGAWGNVALRPGCRVVVPGIGACWVVGGGFRRCGRGVGAVGR